MSAQDHEQSELLNQPLESNFETKADLGYPPHHPPDPSPHHQPLLGRLWPAPKRLHPQSLLLDYIKHLVDRIEDNTKNSHKEALTLVETVGLALKSDKKFHWDTPFLNIIHSILTKHPALEKLQRDDAFVQTVERIEFYKHQSKEVDSSSDNNGGNSRLADRTIMASFVAGIADRIAGDRGIAQIIAELGPSSTRSMSTLRDVLADFARTSGPLNEASLASLCLFFSSAPQQTEVVGLSPALLGSIVPGRGQDNNNWNLDVVTQVLSEDFAAADWMLVATKWDVPSFAMNDTTQFRRLLDLYHAGARNVPPLSAFTRKWLNTSGQLSALEAMLSVPQNIFPVALDEEEQMDALVGVASTSSPNPQCWASADFLQRLLTLSDDPSLYRRIRDQFIRCLTSCPEVLLCSLVRLQLRLANAPDNIEATNAGIQIKTELMRELIPLFFRPSRQRLQNGAGAVRRLYTISPTTVMAACFEAYRITLNEVASSRLASVNHIINIARHLPSPTEAIANLLSGNRDLEYSIAVAFVMADCDYLQLNAWLGEKLSKSGSVTAFAASLISYLRKNFPQAGPKSESVLLSYENIITSLQLLQGLDQSILSSVVTDRTTVGDAIRTLTEMCVATHPSLRNLLTLKSGLSNEMGFQDYYAAVDPGKNEVEEMATAYFQKIYTSEQSISEIVEMLKRFKNSGDKKENEIFASMVHQLFEEYRFFSRYPERELRITGILFGALIQEQLVTSITLGVALKYVLEALRKAPAPAGNTSAGGGKMFRFGMFALEQFKGRLHEWPQYCSHMVQIPHLKEGYADLVHEIEQEMSRVRPPPPVVLAAPNQSTFNHETRSIGSDTDSLPDPIISTHNAEMPRIAEFGPGLGRAVTEGSEDIDYEAPPQATLDRVQFLVNNLAPANVESKAAELRGLLDPSYFDWLGQYLVVKRITTQANHHPLYLSFLDSLGDYGRELVEAILISVYHSIGKLLRSPKITNSSSERGYLKNLGIWLGQITLARNRPIKQIMLDCRELLLQGYETGKLIAVAPFLAKTLEGAKNSVVFRPPNPWLIGILGVFRSVYNVDGLKMNIKFEVEVLCKNLSIKLEDIPLRNDVLAKRIAPVKERNPDFNVKASASTKAYPAANTQPLSTIALPQVTESGRTTPTEPPQDTVIPNLAAYVTVNASIPQLLQSQQGPLASSLSISSLKRWVPIAVDRAIREIIQPVVERSVNIACLTTKEIVSKDFAMESDENKVRKAGQLMAANLAGSLALVTCREPLRSSVSSHLRQLLAASTGRGDDLNEQEQNVIEQCVQICSSDNLELGCKLIEKAATEKALRDLDEALAQAISRRRQHREQTGQPYFDMSIFGDDQQRYPSALPDQLRPTPGGLLPEHFQLYERFQRISRTAVLGSQVPASDATAVSSSRNAALLRGAETPFESADVNQFGPDLLNSIASKLDSAITSLLAVAGTRAREIKLAMLPPDHQICRLIAAVKDIMPNAGPSGIRRQLTASEQEFTLAFSQGIFKRLYELTLSEPLRLESLVALLANVNTFCPKLGKDMGTWATFAPSSNDQQRRLHRTVLLLLVRSRLLSVHDLDCFLAARAESGRNHVWVEFALVFIRTALLERIASTAEFPKIVELLKKIAEGQSQASPQIAQAVRNPILQILEDKSAQPKSSTPVVAALPPVKLKVDQVPEESFLASSSLSADSLHRLSDASKKVYDHTEKFAACDTPDAKKQIMQFLEAWMCIYTSDAARHEKSVGQYLLALQQWGLGKNEEKTERFFRLSAVSLVEAALVKVPIRKESDQRLQINYGMIDLYCKLLHLLFKHMHNGGSQEQVNVQRLAVLNRILGVTIRSMMWHNKNVQAAGRPWDQRPWYRIMLNIIMDFNKPDPLYEPIRLSMLSAFGVAFHACQPLVLPAFSFAWLELVSHRHFLPNLLLFPGQKAWHFAHQLMIDHFLFLEPYLRRIELPKPVKRLYEGTLRVLLVLLHDFPSFLSNYHLSFCNVIPETCIQLRNIILSASPIGLSSPDPFTPNLKIDLLPETRHSPTIFSNILGPIDAIRGHLDACLKDGHRGTSAVILPLLCKPNSGEVDSLKVNSAVLYVAVRALARLQSTQISLSRTPDIEIFERLMEFDDKGRYVCLNAIANQLRFPSSHTHYFSCVILYLFSESKSVAVKEQVTRVLLERLIVHRPHPWGLVITFIELIKNQRYGFWNYPFTRCATEIENLFESVARSCMPPGQRTAAVGGEDL